MLQKLVQVCTVYKSIIITILLLYQIPECVSPL